MFFYFVQRQFGFLKRKRKLINGKAAFVCRLKDLHQRCTKEMDAYVGCMYYHTNEFDLCRKEQEAFEKGCPLE